MFRVVELEYNQEVPYDKGLLFGHERNSIKKNREKCLKYQKIHR